MRFRRNPNFERQLRAQPSVRKEVKDGAERSRRAAHRVAPDETGYYKRRLRVIEVAGTPVLTSLDPFAHLIEWGSANNPPYAPLRRGVRAAGYRLQEGQVRTIAAQLDSGEL